MGSWGESERHRVFVPQALGSDEFLRVTWHATSGLVVFSHWDGDRCVAATPVRAADLEELASLVQAALTPEGSTPSTPAWPAPRQNELVVPADGLMVPDSQRCA